MNSKQTEGNAVRYFLKEYYEWDENEHEPQQPFIHSSISDLEQLLSDYAASLPSKPVGDVEEMAKESFEKISKTNLFENNLIYNIGNKRDSYFIAKRIFSEGFKSGYAAAPECKKCKETEYLITNEPTNFLLVNALRLLDSDGMKALADSLYERVPAAPQKGVNIREKYKQWCKETKRNGSVLVGSSMQEFFNWLDESPSPSEAGDGWSKCE